MSVLYGRDAECAVIDGLLADARAGRSGTLVIRGEAGIGKSALIAYAAASGSDLTTLRGVGVESEAELPFAGLQLLLRGCLDRLDRLPAVQAAALRGAIGLSAKSVADRFLVGLAVLSLLAGLAEDAPVLCLIDDAQWIDRASIDALLFAARRLEADGVAVLIAVGDDGGPFDARGLPELSLDRLERASAGDLLAERAGDLSAIVRNRVLDESAGNPLALSELPAAVTEELRAGRVAAGVGAFSVPRRMERLFQDAVADLPESSQNLLLIVAVDDTSELDVVLRAAPALDASADDLAVIVKARLVEVTRSSVTFRHPLIRAATYHAAPVTARWAAHRALAAALPGDQNADRRAWHLAAAATGPDEAVAAALERSAEQARGRGGVAAVAAAAERAAELSADPQARARRFIIAAEAAGVIGQIDRAAILVDQAEAVVEDPLLLARAIGVRAQVSNARGELDRMQVQLVAAVRLTIGDNPRLALWTLMELVFLSYATGDRGAADLAAELLDTLRLACDDPLVPIRQLLQWFLCQQRGRPPAGLPLLRDTARAALSVEAGGLRGRLIVVGACIAVGDSIQTYDATEALVSKIRAQGAIGLLPHALCYLSVLQLQRGRHRDARATATEAVRIARDTSQHEWVGQASSVLAVLAAYEGDETRCRAEVDVCLGDERGRAGPIRSAAVWALALLDLGRGLPDAALIRLEEHARGAVRMSPSAVRSTPDLVEAAVYAGEPDRVASAFAEYERWAGQARQPWIDALVLRCRALLAPSDEVGRHYAAALATHEPGRPFERARTALLYGESLRRERRRADARVQLRVALETFERLGANPWVERARRELRATGETVAANPFATDRLNRLTSQELQVVRLAAAGLSNRAIGAQLYLSPRTVGYHLYNAYPKLGVASRGELARLIRTDP